MLDFCEVKKLSTQMTSSPAETSRSQRCEPRNPAPPVTRMRLVMGEREELGVRGQELGVRSEGSGMIRWLKDSVIQGTILTCHRPEHGSGWSSAQ